MKKRPTVIAKTDELKNNEMKRISFGEEYDILLIRVNDQFYATEAYCPHYHAPLDTGIISDKKIMCPWHHAQFRITDGDLIQPPALEGLKCYDLEIRDNDIFIIPEDTAKDSGSENAIDKKDYGSDPTYVIIGGGAAGNSAARQLRKLGFNGRIQMISADSQPPYDRPNLSKDFLKEDFNPEWLPLNSSDFYQENKIEFIPEKRVVGVDNSKKQIELHDKTMYKFDKLLIATGATPRVPDIPGIDLDNIFTLRSADDADSIKNAAGKSKSIAVVGAGFVGMETAENLNNDQREIHIIAPESLPFSKQFGTDFGRLILDKKSNDGIKFHLEETITEFRGNSGIEEVVLENGKSIPADMVVIGAGVDPEPDFMPQYVKAKDGSLLADKYLEVEKNVYAAGDVTTFPYKKSKNLIRVEHWRVAEQLGILAAQNMYGTKTEVDIIPFFWMNLAGLHARYVGFAEKWDHTIIHGDLNKEEFIIYYVSRNRIEAALGVNQDLEMAVIEELLRLDKMPDADTLKNNPVSADILEKL
jgi:NADPH-dependent 2,4-dienoyl-CoA reductase/sulfur reductase-like enzyme/nitrite reductase/ring-hydroxylating ferredoxin subunit